MRNVSRTKYLALLALIFLLLLSACSSDEDTNPQRLAGVPANAIQITSDNVKDVATDTMDSRSGVDSTSDQNSVLPSQVNSKKKVTIEQFAKSLLSEPANQEKYSSVFAAVDNTSVGTINCSEMGMGGGSGTMTYSAKIDPGTDSFTGTFTFDQCDLVDIVLNGTISLAETCSVTDTTDICKGTMRSALLSIEEQGESIDLEHLLIEYTDNNYAPFNTSEDYSYELMSTKFKGGVLVETTQTLVYDGIVDYPSSGQITITGAAGSQARITVIDNTQFTLELDETGSGTFVEEADSPYFWQDIDAGLI